MNAHSKPKSARSGTRGVGKRARRKQHSQSESVIGGVERRGTEQQRRIRTEKGDRGEPGRSWRRNAAATVVASSSLQSGSRLIVLQQDIHK